MILATRVEILTGLAEAEVAVRQAAQELDAVRIRRDEAHANWFKVVEDRRRAHVDRRNPDSYWDHAFADRRRKNAERRRAEASLATLIAEVNARDSASRARSQADLDFAIAEGKLRAAIVNQEKAAAALAAFNRAG